MFLSSGMHIFKHSYLLTLASRGLLPSVLALSVKVVVQEHLFVDHFKGNLQLHFSLNVPSKFSISHALFKDSR